MRISLNPPGFVVFVVPCDLGLESLTMKGGPFWKLQNQVLSQTLGAYVFLMCLRDVGC